MSNSLSIDDLMKMKLEVIDEAIASKKLETESVSITQNQVVPVTPEPMQTSVSAVDPASVLNGANRRGLSAFVVKEIEKLAAGETTNANGAVLLILQECGLPMTQYFEHGEARQAAYNALGTAVKMGLLECKGRNNYVRTNKKQPPSPASIGKATTNFLQDMEERPANKDWDNKHLWKPHMIHVIESMDVPSAYFQPKDIIEPMVKMKLVKNQDEHISAARRMLDKLLLCLVNDKVLSKNTLGAYKKVHPMHAIVSYEVPDAKRTPEIALKRPVIVVNADKIRIQVGRVLQMMKTGDVLTTNEIVDLIDWSDIYYKTNASRRSSLTNALRDAVAQGFLEQLPAPQGTSHSWKRLELPYTLQ